MTQQMQHTFVVCAYKESEYLEACIQSLLAQTVKSRILISTATPNAHISALAERYGLDVRVNTGDHGIAQDWNFAYAQAETALVTLAHQDDIYDPGYAAAVIAAAGEAKHPLICFTGYYEIRDGRRVEDNDLLRVKRKLLSPLKLRPFRTSRFVRRRSLSLGNAICCPAVTYVRDNLPQPLFPVGFRSNVDWETWEHISRMKGAFCYIPAPLMGHRVHAGSETSAVIGDGDGRTAEDYAMFRKFWPKWIADRLIRMYAKGQKSNQI